MKKFLKILPFLIFVVIVYWEFLRPKLKTPELTLNGEVIIITEYKRAGSHLLEVKENKTTKYLNYSFLNQVFDIDIGDSVFKEAGSITLFVKRKTDSIFREANNQEFTIYP